jgi:hypothetical protein
MDKIIDITTKSIDLYSNYQAYSKSIQKNQYEIVENLILYNKINLIKIILTKEDISILFKPGFRRKDNSEKRMISNYLFLIISDEMKELLLSNSNILNILYKYNNKYLMLCK